MIGRKAIGNPFIFTSVLARINGESEDEHDIGLRFDLMARYLRASVRYIGEEHACRMMRSRLCWFVKGLPNSSHFRKSINHISTQAEALQRIEAFKESLEVQK